MDYRYILGLYEDNGKEHGNYHSILGLYWDNGKENGNCCSILGSYLDDAKYGSVSPCRIISSYLPRVATAQRRRRASFASAAHLLCVLLFGDCIVLLKFRQPQTL